MAAAASRVSIGEGDCEKKGVEVGVGRLLLLLKIDFNLLSYADGVLQSV